MADRTMALRDHRPPSAVLADSEQKAEESDTEGEVIFKSLGGPVRRRTSSAGRGCRENVEDHEEYTNMSR